MFVRTYAGALTGIDAVTVTVEADTGAGIGMYLVGLPDNAVRESQERIRTAFINSGYRMTGRKTVVNLAPADLRKEGSAFDLAIAVAVLASSEQIEGGAAESYMILGELSLDGSLRPVKGALPLALGAQRDGLRGVILPVENAAEAAVVEGLEVIGVKSLRETVDFLTGQLTIPPTHIDLKSMFESGTGRFGEDFSDVKGQAHAKRALEIAAAGGHNVIMIGAPGSGKTMLARRLPTILPPMTLDEALETTKIHSVAGKLGSSAGLITERPFRAPHHLASQVALIGGGSTPQPGEASLAHNGILFLDELPEFGRNLLEVLRQPLEDKKITVSRAKYSVEYPANFTLIASMNPCPCGYYNHPTKECTCTSGEVFRYMNRISGPLLDRIDLHIEVAPVAISDLADTRREQSSAEIRERVIRAREIQTARFAAIGGIHTNAMMNSKMLREYCPLDSQARRMLEQAMERLNLSARAFDRIIKVARTIADLAAAEHISPAHIAEAITYRSLDRDSWGR